MNESIDICIQTALISNKFEINNSDLKRRYLIKNIQLYNDIVKSIDYSKGSFGTGYPFYALEEGLVGN